MNIKIFNALFSQRTSMMSWRAYRLHQRKVYVSTKIIYLNNHQDVTFHQTRNFSLTIQNLRKDTFNNQVEVEDATLLDSFYDRPKKAAPFSQIKYTNSRKDSIIFQEHENLFKSCRELDEFQWESMQKLAESNGGKKIELVDAIIMKECVRVNNYPLAASYLKYVEHQGRTPNTGTLAIYLDICTTNHQECGETVLLSVIERVCGGASMLSYHLSERVILGLCRTSNWRDSYHHLTNITSQQVGLGSTVLGALTCAAFRDSDTEAAWHFFALLCRKRPQVDLVPVCQAYLEYCHTLEPAAREKACVSLLRRMGDMQVFPDAKTTSAIADTMKELGWRHSHVQPNQSGSCPSCGERLELTPIAEETFARLKTEFVERVLKRGDLYLKTSPEEWQQFQSMLTSRGPFTHVVDGLNIAYNGSGKSKFHKQNLRMAEQVVSVVEYLLEECPGAKVIVICREHMRYWNKFAMERLRKLAHLYFLANLTSDDSYILYSALHSGINTKIVTKDLLRDHLFLLEDDTLQHAFRLWQQRAQQPIQWGRPPTPKPASTYTTTCQSSSDSLCWHLPYDDGRLVYSYDLPRTWVCLRHATHPGKTLSTPRSVSKITVPGDESTVTNLRSASKITHDLAVNSLRDEQLSSNEPELSTLRKHYNSPEDLESQKIRKSSNQVSEEKSSISTHNKTINKKKSVIDLKSLFS